jgi:hypothetical protein
VPNLTVKELLEQLQSMLRNGELGPDDPIIFQEPDRTVTWKMESAAVGNTEPHSSGGTRGLVLSS